MAKSEDDLKALMLASLDGDATAYGAVLAELRDRLRGYFDRRLRSQPGEAEDLVQDTLIAVHTRRATYDRTRPFTPWAYAIARYKLIDHYRRLGARATVPLEDAWSELRVDDGSAAADARRDLETGLAQLSPRARTLVRSLKLEERSTAETAERMGMSEGAVKVALHRGLKVLAAKLRGGEGADD